MFKAYSRAQETKKEVNEQFSSFPIQPTAVKNEDGETSDIVSQKRPPEDTRPKSRNPFAKNKLNSSKTPNVLSIKYKTISKKPIPSKKKDVKVPIETVIEFFVSDSKGDKGQLGLSCMYFADVPLYLRKFNFRKTIGKRSWRNSSDDVKHPKRYYKRKLASNPELVNPKMSGIENYSKEFLHFEVLTSGASKDTQSESFLQDLDRKIQNLNMSLRFEPKNVPLWLNLVEMQPMLFRTEHDDKFTAYWREKLAGGSMIRQAIAEKQLAVLDRALEQNPGNSKLFIHKLSLLHHTIAESDKIRNEWKNHLIAAPNNLQAWSKFFDFMIYHSSYDVEIVLTAFSTCFRYLIGMKNGTFKSHTLNFAAADTLIIEIHLKLLYFLLKAGHIERFCSLVQTIFEFNLNYNAKSSYEERLSEFKAYYESDSPKLGQNSYVPLAAFLQINVSQESVKVEKIESEKDEMPEVEKLLRPDLPMWKNWIALERARCVHQVTPCKLSEECDDTARAVSFEFIKQFMFPFDPTQFISFVNNLLILLHGSVGNNLKNALQILDTPELADLHIHNLPGCDLKFLPNLKPLFDNIIEMCGNHKNLLMLYLRWSKLLALEFPEKRPILKKKMKSVLQRPGNQNNLSIWKAMLYVEMLDSNVKVVQKTMDIVGKLCKGVQSEVFLDFRVYCVMLMVGLCCPCNLASDLNCNNLVMIFLDEVKNKTQPSLELKLKFLELYPQRVSLDSVDEMVSQIENLQHIEKNEALTNLKFLLRIQFKRNQLNPKQLKIFTARVAERTKSSIFLDLLLEISSNVYKLPYFRRFVDNLCFSSSESISILYYAILSEKFLREELLESTNRQKSLLERGLNSWPNSCYLWESYLQLSLATIKSQSAGEDAYHRGVSNVPFCKPLYFIFLTYFPEILEQIVESMLKRKIRIKTPIEEVELLLQILDASSIS